MLGRIITYEGWGLQMEADPGHRELIIKDLELKDAKAVATPGEPEAKQITMVELRHRREQGDRGEGGGVAQDINGDSETLPDGRLQRYASVAARGNYLAADRPDIQFEAKERMRSLSTPTVGDERRLKRMGRYLLGASRYVCKYPWRPVPEEVIIYADANHAGCIKTRLSTVGGVLTWGGAFIKSYSKTIQTVCLSTGESELAAMVRGAAEGIGLRSTLSDLGYAVRVTIMSDATAAIGMTKRQGLGAVRHLATADLWVQQRVREKDIAVRKVGGHENPSDCLTKNLSAEHSRYLLAKVGFEFTHGRSDVAPVRAEI